MVAYSFQSRFVLPIQAGTKCQTIRAPRRRHARVGEELQLYTEMRTKRCRLIGRVPCVSVTPVRLVLTGPGEVTHCDVPVPDIDAFARLDGFADWPELVAFWAKAHPGIDVFEGVLIRWRGLSDAEGGGHG